VTNRAVNYVYDPVGNRQTMTDNGTNTAYTANNLNQYTAVGLETPTYDANGNLTSQAGWSYSYDAQNRLIAAGNGSTSVSFAYDARNRCVKRVTNGVTTYLLYDGWSLIEERDAGDNVLASYIHGAAIDEILTLTSSLFPLTTFYYHHDGLGSVTHVTDSGGLITENYSYDVYGAPSVFDGSGLGLPSSAVGNRFAFTGREYLADLGLYDYRNRFYSPSLGRFLQTDPIRFGAGDVNLYRYVGNWPTILLDPTGESLWMYLPQIVQAVSEFFQGLVVPGPPPPTPAGVLGAAVSTYGVDVCEAVGDYFSQPVEIPSYPYPPLDLSLIANH
jgi:RHS repeat-associated protein